MIDLKALDDEALDGLRIAVLTEQERRDKLTNTPALVAELTGVFLAAVEDPDEPPTWEEAGGIWAAGTLLADGDRVWRNITTVPLTTPPSGFPGAPSAWSHLFVRVDAEDTGPQAWVQPTGAHDAYQKDDQVSHNGNTWTSTVAANVWEPGAYGWTKQ